MNRSFNALDLRTWILKNTIAMPVLGKNYIDFHTDNNECGLELFLDGKKFTILITEEYENNT